MNVVFLQKNPKLFMLFLFLYFSAYDLIFLITFYSCIFFSLDVEKSLTKEKGKRKKYSDTGYQNLFS